MTDRIIITAVIMVALVLAASINLISDMRMERELMVEMDTCLDAKRFDPSVKCSEVNQ